MTLGRSPDYEHVYFDQLHDGGNETFDAAYNRARERYFALLSGSHTAPQS